MEKPADEFLNILLLGETGVGKSTWINGLTTYTTFNTLIEAKSSSAWQPVIPVQFTMTDAAYTEVLVKLGEDPNEHDKVGQSSTQTARTYEFTSKGTKIRIIDTPDIGDTRGVEIDKANFENTFQHISKFNHLDAVCILLKPNNSKLTTMFQFCIHQLLSHIKREAFSNIIFCFTHSRNTFYRPGDTMPALREILKQYPDISLNNQTVYCIDNEAVRYLTAVRAGCGGSFNESEEQSFEQSWSKSVEETERLMRYVSSLKPYKMKKSNVTFDGHQKFQSLTNPILEMLIKIQQNIRAIEIEIQEHETTKRDMLIFQQNISSAILACNLVVLQSDTRIDPHRTDADGFHSYRSKMGYEVLSPEILTINLQDQKNKSSLQSQSIQEKLLGIYLSSRKLENDAHSLETYIETTQQDLRQQINNLNDKMMQFLKVCAKISWLLKLYPTESCTDALENCINNYVGNKQDSTKSNDLKICLSHYQHQMDRVASKMSTQEALPKADADDLCKQFLEKLVSMEICGTSVNELLNVDDNVQSHGVLESQNQNANCESVVSPRRVMGTNKVPPIVKPKPTIIPPDPKRHTQTGLETSGRAEEKQTPSGNLDKRVASSDGKGNSLSNNKSTNITKPAGNISTSTNNSQIVTAQSNPTAKKTNGYSPSSSSKPDVKSKPPLKPQIPNVKPNVGRTNSK